MTNHALLTVLVTAIALSGCPQQESQPSPEPTPVDYLSVVGNALAGAAGFAIAAQANAVANSNFIGCIASGSVAAALDTAASEIISLQEQVVIIPAVSFSLSDCNGLSERTLDGVNVPSAIKLYIDAGTKSAESLLEVNKQKILDANCKAYYLLEAGLRYLQGAYQPVLDFLADISNPVSIPAVEVNLFECAE